MKIFIRNIALTFGCALLALTLADLGYTAILTSAAPSNKIALLKSHAGEEFDYIFVGSSRVNNDIIPSVIKARTGKKALNLGVSSARPTDILTIVKMLHENNIQSDSIFIQIDYGFNYVHDRSKLMENWAMPFLWDDAALRDHISYKPNAFAIKYVPFYRYAAYDQGSGLRTVFETLREKNASDLRKSSGYMMRRGQLLLKDYALPDTIAARNPSHEALVRYASRNNYKLVFFTSPFMTRIKNKGYMAKLKARVPQLHDYSQAITPDSLFSNQSHLNHEGAIVFTNRIIDDLILSKRKP